MNKDEPKKEVEVLPKGSKVDLTKEEKPKKPVDEKAIEAMKKISVEMWTDLLEAVLGARLRRIERMLEWLVVQRVTDDQKLIKQPNISDILKQIMSNMEPAGLPTKAEKTEEEKEDEKTEGGGPSEVPPAT